MTDKNDSPRLWNQRLHVGTHVPLKYSNRLTEENFLVVAARQESEQRCKILR